MPFICTILCAFSFFPRDFSPHPFPFSLSVMKFTKGNVQTVEYRQCLKESLSAQHNPRPSSRTNVYLPQRDKGQGIRDKEGIENKGEKEGNKGEGDKDICPWKDKGLPLDSENGGRGRNPKL